jgi:hypothetical protein
MQKKISGHIQLKLNRQKDALVLHTMKIKSPIFRGLDDAKILSWI